MTDDRKKFLDEKVYRKVGGKMVLAKRELQKKKFDDGVYTYYYTYAKKPAAFKAVKELKAEGKKTRIEQHIEYGFRMWIVWEK